MRRWKIWIWMCLCTLCLHPAAYACASCFGKSDSKMAEGMNAGILSLLVVVGIVLASFGAFFVFLARRANTPLATSSEPANS